MFKLIKDVKLRKGLKGYIIKFDSSGLFIPEVIHCEVGCHDGFVNKLAERFSDDYEIKPEDIFVSVRDFNRSIKHLVKQRNAIINKRKRLVYFLP